MLVIVALISRELTYLIIISNIKYQFNLSTILVCQTKLFAILSTQNNSNNSKSYRHVKIKTYSKRVNPSLHASRFVVRI